MPIESVAVPPAGAFDALRTAIDHHKRDHPLVPVTVIVPTNAAGVTARRWLGRHGGVAAVDMLTLGRVAELLAGPVLAATGRHPVSAPVIELVLGDLLATDPGGFGAVAEHPSTIEALRELHHELRLAGPDAPNLLAGNSVRGRIAAEVSVRLTARLGERWYDSADLLASAAEQVATHPLPDRLRRLVVFQPNDLSGLERALLDALAAVGEVTVITPDVSGVVGGPEVQVVSATDADEEVRYAVRAVLAAARTGTQLGRVAIAWPTDVPYARLVEHHLTVAELAWNGRPGTQATERVVPRFLLDLLDVDRRGLRRHDLFDLLADIELHAPDGGRLPVARWERVSRAAGVAGGSDWERRLNTYAATERERAAARDYDHPRTADDAERLANYVGALRRELGPRHHTRSWSEWAQWCEQQVVGKLGEVFLARLPEAEQLAWMHTAGVLDRLAALDSVAPAPVTRATFRAVFEAEFEAAPGRLGRIGEGVTVGSLAGLSSPDLDLVIVVGAAEGSLPPQPSSGPLISDGDRLAAGLALSDAGGIRLHRHFLAAVGSAARSIVTWPRGDLRGSAEREPSRWVGQYLANATQVTLDSHHAALLGAEFPAHATEFRLRAALAGGPAAAAPHDPVLAGALAMRSARRRPELTGYDGDLTGVSIDHFAAAVAPTQIEQWVSCPHGYFMRYVLGVYPVDDPQAEMEIPSFERGNVVHDTLDRLNHEVLDGGLPQPRGGWGPVHITRALAIFDEICGHFEATGRTGRPASWAFERARLRQDLRNWFEADRARLAANHAEIVSSEAAFGYDAPVHLPLPGGARLAVKGRIDRVDREPSGRLIVVDHKTGSARDYAVVDDDPTAFGTLFQLPTYAAGARALTGQPDADVAAYYSFFARGKYRQHGYVLDDDAWGSVTEQLGNVIDGIRSGLFPHRPEAPGFQLFVRCKYCQPDGLSTADLYAEWEAKRNDPRGARWFADEVPA